MSNEEEKIEREAFIRWSYMKGGELSPAQKRFIEGDDGAIHYERVAEWLAWSARATRQSSAPAAIEPLAPRLRQRANVLLSQLAENHPRRALDIDATRSPLEQIAIPSDIEKLIEELVRCAWEWGVSCEIDDVRWGEAGDSHNQMWRDRAIDAVTQLQAALLSARPPAPEEGKDVARKPLTHMQIVMLWGHRSDGPSSAEIVSFARHIERHHGIDGEVSKDVGHE